MTKLVIEANLSDEQIAILAIGLGYELEIDGKEEMVKGDDVEEMEDGKPVLDADGNKKMIPTFELVTPRIPNPQSDDEFLREWFANNMKDIASEIFARAEIEKIDKQKEAILQGIGGTVADSITTKKQI